MPVYEVASEDLGSTVAELEGRGEVVVSATAHVGVWTVFTAPARRVQPGQPEKRPQVGEVRR